MLIYLQLFKNERICYCTFVNNLIGWNSQYLLFFSFIELNASLYVAHVKAPDENPMLEHRDSMSKTQMQIKKQRISKGEILNSKYNYYR